MPCSVSQAENDYYYNEAKKKHPQMFAIKEAYENLSRHHIEVEQEAEKLRKIIEHLLRILADSDQREKINNIYIPEPSKPYKELT